MQSHEPEIQQWKKVLFLESILKRGIDIQTAARVFGFPISTAYRLAKAYNEQGDAAVFDNRYGPRKSSIEKTLPDDYCGD